MGGGFLAGYVGKCGGGSASLHFQVIQDAWILLYCRSVNCVVGIGVEEVSAPTSLVIAGDSAVATVRYPVLRRNLCGKPM